ncbi:PAS domain-containing sensor histidine kinase [Helicobacter sp. MIT 99-5507]|uniref:sensor histidine kinase n=1 Tax=Helicobacter sp. MIT 99-5507 TaxID=152489 RepID=UPI000E1EA1D2|nr:ATP-binding protein [Helicobacter sp. MIT 99-5507]RDU58277.1 two-component sensor histidine kinase [Helicobacter sp. MIT 99-5507]
MDSFEDIFKSISSNIHTKDQKEHILSILDEFINQTYKAEKEFNDLKEVFSLVLESIPNPIWVINEDNSYFYYNSYAKKIDDILKKYPQELNECEILFEKEYYLMQRSKKHNKTLITATNITNEKRKERLASMGQISAHLAHEIRNPIGAIALMLSSLSKNIDSKHSIYILEMKKALWRVERLINTTLLFCKGVKAISQKYDSSLIKSNIEDSVVYFEYSKNIDFIYDIRVDSIWCDLELLELLLQNLISNAIEAIEECDEIENGIIKIEFFIKDNKQILKVYDNGVLASDIDNLFEAFKTTKIKGNGLGLAFCKQIAEAHNGIITYNDKGKKYFLVSLGL